MCIVQSTEQCFLGSKLPKNHSNNTIQYNTIQYNGTDITDKELYGIVWEQAGLKAR